VRLPQKCCLRCSSRLRLNLCRNIIETDNNTQMIEPIMANRVSAADRLILLLRVERCPTKLPVESLAAAGGHPSDCQSYL